MVGRSWAPWAPWTPWTPQHPTALPVAPMAPMDTPVVARATLCAGCARPHTPHELGRCQADAWRCGGGRAESKPVC